MTASFFLAGGAGAFFGALLAAWVREWWTDRLLRVPGVPENPPETYCGDCGCVRPPHAPGPVCPACKWPIENWPDDSPAPGVR